MITETQVFLTRECNLNCGYCKLTENKLQELSFDEWKQGFINLRNIGIKTVKIMGGEPTVKEWLPELIKFISSLGIKSGLLSNSSFNDNMLDKLRHSGLHGYFASIDCHEENNYDGHPIQKTNDGWIMLKKLENYIPLLAGNVVINKFNISEIPSIIECLSSKGYYINLCTIQTTSLKDKEFSKNSVKYSFNENDKELLRSLSKTLLKMKKEGCSITVPEKYIEGIHEFGIKNDWQCSYPSQLRVDADGGIMLCNEWRTKLSDELSIFDIDENFYKVFLRRWKEIRKNLNCDGCYWSSIVQAQDNIDNDNLEFHYN